MCVCMYVLPVNYDPVPLHVELLESIHSFSFYLLFI